MSKKPPKNVLRAKPSTKARSRSYVRLQMLVILLDKLELCYPFYVDENGKNCVDYKGWKRWANTHTPPDKRGGPSEH